jgi:DNA-binding transcriptional regulator YdaS (Cro superfamily)
MDNDGLRKAIEAADGKSALARGLNISPAAVCQWKRVPADRVLSVERITGVSRHELRPDLYGPASNAVA